MSDPGSVSEGVSGGTRALSDCLEGHLGLYGGDKERAGQGDMLWCTAEGKIKSYRYRKMIMNCMRVST
jgi:hypothetical protein